MSRFQDLTDFFRRLLRTAAREDLIGHFETTISGYEEEISRQQKLLDVVLKPEMKLRRAVFPADVQQLLVNKEEVPPQQQEWRPLLDQEEPEPPHIKEEQEEVWSSQDGEQLQQLEEADISKESRFQDLKDLFKQQLLSAAREDLIGHFETTIFRYEKEISRRQKLLDVVLNPEIKLRRAVCPDVQQLSREDVPTEQQRWSPLLVKEEPEPPHIKEEQEELWSSQDGEQLQQLEEADISKFTFTPVPVKSEDDDDDEEKPQSSQLHQTQTEQMRREAAGEDCGGPEPARNSDPQRHLGPDEETEGSSETDDSDETWTESRKPQSRLKKHEPVKVAGGLRTFASAGGQFLLHCCSECGKRFSNKTNMKVHMRIHTQEKPFTCLVCGQMFRQGERLRQHMAVHSGQTRLSCTDCGKRFIWYRKFRFHKCVPLQSSQLFQRYGEQMEREAHREDCGGARNSDPAAHSTSDSDSCETAKPANHRRIQTLRETSS